MPRTRKMKRHRIHRRRLRGADLPSVPELDLTLTPARGAALADKQQVVADTDLTEDAIRRIVEAAYT